MKKWRFALIIWVILSLVLLVLASVYNWSPLMDKFPGMNANPRAQQLAAEGLNLPRSVGILTTLAALYFGGVALLLLIPHRVKVIGTLLFQPIKSSLRLVLLGLVIFFFMLGTGISAIVSSIMFPLGVLIGLLTFFVTWIGLISLAQRLGSVLLLRAGLNQLSSLLALFVGLFLLYSLTVIPYFGALLWIIYACMSMGAMVSTHFGVNKPWTLEPLYLDEEEG